MIAGTTNKTMNISNFKNNTDFSFICFLVIQLQGLVAVFPFSYQIQKLELQEPSNTLYIPYAQQHSGAVNNPVLREVDTLKIALSTLCNISQHSECSGRSCCGKIDWENGKEEAAHFKQQIIKAKVKDEVAKKTKYSGK